MSRTRIFIVHENKAVASQATATFAQDPNVRVMDMLETAGDALAYIGENNCDVILLSSTLPQDGALTVAKTLRRRGVQAKVIVTGLINDTREIIRYIAAGAAGYALRREGIEAWLRQVEAVRTGKALISAEVTAALINHLAKLSRLTTRFEPKPQLYANLTEREIEVLHLMAEDYSNQEIAEQLIVSVGTVKNHVHSVLKKLSLRSRKETMTYLSFVQGQTQQRALPLA